MNVQRLYNTIKYLRFEQLYYRFYYKIKKRTYTYPTTPATAVIAAKAFPPIKFPALGGTGQFEPSKNTFHFLNRSHSFGDEIDWNYAAEGKLWNYNLNYFEWLSDETIEREIRQKALVDYSINDEQLGNIVEAYPISLRGMNWIKFMSQHQVKDERPMGCLYRHYHRLSAFPEYQLLGNHLLENGLSLFFAAHYFNGHKFYGLARKILLAQLPEQILADGVHYELSPMYQCIILQHLLDCIMLAENSGRFKDNDLLQLMRETAGRMGGWLKGFCYRNGSYAMFGDSTFDVAPSPDLLYGYLSMLDIPVNGTPLKESGYRKMNTPNYELVADIGNVQPAYQPGHTHADTFSFCLQVEGKPFIVDTGISTYEKGARRLDERGTAAHNTIMVNGLNSSDVWSAFRTGERAEVQIIEDCGNKISASHDGYKKKGIIHKRSIACDNQKIIIKDLLEGYKGQEASLYLHFHPDVLIENIGGNQFIAGNIRITIDGAYSMALHNYLYCEGYNRLAGAKCLQANIKEHVTVVIELLSYAG